MRKVAYECKYYLGDRPCTWHKQKGLLCVCDYFTPLKGSLLIIKLDAMGDVLRTTCLLPAIVKSWPQKRIMWITSHQALPLLENNPYITEIAAFGPEALAQLSSRKFDIVINFDAGKVSASIATMVKGEKKIGYVLHKNGYVIGTNRPAREWLRMGIFDDLKRANHRSYQEIMCSILGLPADDTRYILDLTAREKEAGRDHLLGMGLDLQKSIIGIHTGGGGRWELKQWHEDKFVRLIQCLLDEHGSATQVLLLGGYREREQNERIMRKFRGLIFDAGCDNGVRHFASLIGQCSVVVSGDSLAMHVSLAMGRRVVVLFGPTSSTEIELYELGEKILPELDCLACYKSSCSINPNCMESISVSTVKQAIMRQLQNIQNSYLSVDSIKTLEK